jgi:hypothetical protein
MIKLFRPFFVSFGKPLMALHHRPEKLLTDGWGAKEPRKLLTDFLCYNCGIKEPELIASCALQFKE